MTDKTIQPQEQRIESWKEIATYLKRDVRTVIRWEKSEGLPVHRQMHQARGNVFAYPSELEAWKSSRELRLTAPPPITPWRRAVSAAAFAAAMMLSLVTLASGPILNPTIASAQGIVNRQVWAGPDVDPEGAPSPDSKYLPYVDWETGDLAVFDLVTGEKRHLTHKGTWADNPDEFAQFSVPSPDSKQIAYGWHKDKIYELRVVGMDGSNLRTLYRNDSVLYVEPKAWSPDGKQILVTFAMKDRSTQIVMVSPADGSVRVLKEVKSDPWEVSLSQMCLSPDGRYIAYSLRQKDKETNHDVFLLSADGSRELPVVTHPADDYFLGWVPDGKTLLFASDRTGAVSGWAIEVVDGKPQGSPRLLKSDIGRITPLGFTEKGTFYYALNTSIRELYTAAVDFASGKLITPPAVVTERFTATNAAPAWSPDGKYLAYMSVRQRPQGSALFHGSDTIVIRSLESGQEREISPKLTFLNSFNGLRWSTDGRFFVVRGIGRDNRQAFYRIDAQTGETSMLLENDPINKIIHLKMTPDGKSVVYAAFREKGMEIMIRDLASGQVREVGSLRVGMSGLTISPDGRQIAFTTQAGQGELPALMVMPLAGGKPRELYSLKDPTKNGWSWDTVAWTRGGGQIVFGTGGRGLNNQKTELWVIAAEGGEPRKLDLTMDAVDQLRIHPDGQRVAFESGVYTSEVWVMENFLPALRAAK